MGALLALLRAQRKLPLYVPPQTIVNAPFKAVRLSKWIDSWRIVGNPEVMMRIGSAGITSGLPVIRPQSRIGPGQILGKHSAT